MPGCWKHVEKGTNVQPLGWATISGEPKGLIDLSSLPLMTPWEPIILPRYTQVPASFRQGDSGFWKDPLAERGPEAGDGEQSLLPPLRCAREERERVRPKSHLDERCAT